ncbi:aspartyl/asparaginyl beta-hydroxylase isoform 9 [Mus musculus]|uniref:Aspartate-beta-hydroxylase n=1 Tax=Mus musculus TaxID=10090 RepID=A2AL74_MOUSE|nr:aspartyl/asparaginyl beta-hydroxylase isoform 9 [Mus musculus]|eukprot:NP_001171325.1 aspartyl/asparaginyl beta-hydroxylase isoform 9 [Mus musculus]
MAEDKEAKHGGHKNGRRGGISGGSFFTWFMVIALLGVWTSVAVVWFDLVDYEEVLGKLGVYDADGDGDFDVDDAKVLLDLEADGLAGEPQPEVEDFLTVTDSDDRFEDLEPGTVHEEIEDTYHVEDTASQNHPNDMEEMTNEQENSDPSEAVTDAGVLLPHAEEVRHQDYDEPVYEPSEHEGVAISDNTIDDSSIISEEINVASVEEQQDTPPDT